MHDVKHFVGTDFIYNCEMWAQTLMLASHCSAEVSNDTGGEEITRFKKIQKD